MIFLGTETELEPMLLYPIETKSIKTRSFIGLENRK